MHQHYYDTNAALRTSHFIVDSPEDIVHQIKCNLQGTAEANSEKVKQLRVSLGREFVVLYKKTKLVMTASSICSLYLDQKINRDFPQTSVCLPFYH